MRSNDIKNNYNKVKQQIEFFKSEFKIFFEVKFIVVTKYANIDEIKVLLDLGHKDFGENRVLETIEKWQDLKDAFSPKLHLIGRLQSNKIEQAVEFFDTIHTVESKKQIDLIESTQAKLNIKRDYLIQLNVGEEPQKSGVSPLNLDELVAYSKAKNFEIAGLMCIPPKDKEPFPYFGLMKNLKLKYGFHHLSMGMTDDYVSALKFGSTMLRIGSAIFGE